MVRRVGVSRCKYRWRYNQHKAPTLASIECCRHIHHLLSDRITARYTAPRSVELCLGESKVGGSKREQGTEEKMLLMSFKFLAAWARNCRHTNSIVRRNQNYFQKYFKSEVFKIVSEVVFGPLCITSGCPSSCSTAVGNLSCSGAVGNLGSEECPISYHTLASPTQP